MPGLKKSESVESGTCNNNVVLMYAHCEILAHGIEYKLEVRNRPGRWPRTGRKIFALYRRGDDGVFVAIQHMTAVPADCFAALVNALAEISKWDPDDGVDTDGSADVATRSKQG